MVTAKTNLFGWAAMVVVGLCSSVAQAEIVAIETFSGKVQKYSVPGDAPTEFAQLNLRSVSSVLSGIHFHQATNRLYVTELDRQVGEGRIHTLNATTGQVLGVTGDLGFGSTSLTIDSMGGIYVGEFGSDTVRVFDPTLTNVIDTIDSGAGVGTAGMTFASNGDLYLSTFGAGVYRFDGTNVNPFNGQQLAAGQMAFDAAGDLYVGHGLGFSNSAFKFASDGTEILSDDNGPFLTIDPSMISGEGGSSLGTSPTGIAFDDNGNLIVAVQGQANPFDTEPERGGLFLFDTDGNLLDTFASGSRAMGGVAFVTAVPEPGSMAFLGCLAAGGFWWKRRRSAAAAGH